MELTINILLLVLYGLSILHLGFRFLMLGACHGDPKGALQARYNFYIALTFFLIMSAIMIFRFSLWFGVPVILLFVIPLFVYVYDEMKYKRDRRKRASIDRTE